MNYLNSMFFLCKFWPSWDGDEAGDVVLGDGGQGEHGGADSAVWEL